MNSLASYFIVLELTPCVTASCDIVKYSWVIVLASGLQKYVGSIFGVAVMEAIVLMPYMISTCLTNKSRILLTCYNMLFTLYTTSWSGEWRSSSWTMPDLELRAKTSFTAIHLNDFKKH